MLEAFLERLRLITELTSEEFKEFDRWNRLSEERKLLRLEMELYKAEKEAELDQIANAMSDLDYADAMADSFRGGPDADASY